MEIHSKATPRVFYRQKFIAWVDENQKLLGIVEIPRSSTKSTVEKLQEEARAGKHKQPEIYL